MTNTISLIFNSQPDCKDALLNWIKQKKFSQPIFITDDNSLLTKTLTPCPSPTSGREESTCISIAELIPIMSKTEEAIYRFHHHYRRFFAKKFPIYSQGINLIADELHAYPFETTARCLAAFLTVKDQYQDVIFIFSQNDMALILQLRALLQTVRQNGLAEKQNIVIFDEKKQDFKRVRGGFYGFYTLAAVRRALSKVSFFSRRPPACPRDPETMLSTNLDPADKPRDVEYKDNTMFLQTTTHKPKKKNPLLFITTSAELHRRNFKPVYEALGKELNTTPLAIAMTKKAEALAKEDGIVLTPLTSPKRLFCSFKFCRRLSCILINTSFLKNIFLKKIKYFWIPRIKRGTSCYGNKQLQKNLFFQQLIILFSKQGLSARLLRNLIKIEQMDRCFKEHRPTVVYKNVATSPYDYRLALIAKKYESPVITSIVASISNRYRNFGIFPCDFVTLLGENQKPIMHKRGYSDKQLICVGQPELDNIKVNTSNKNDLFTILIATGYVNLSEEKIWITALNQFAEKSTFPLRILLKPHPSAQSFYTNLNHLQHIHILSRDVDIYAYLTTAQLVITDVSHVGKLAIYFEKPLMVVNFSGQDFPFNNFAQENVAWLATDEIKVGEIIEGIRNGTLQINQQAYKNYIQQHLTNNDHQACKRIVNWLLSNSF